MKRNADRANIAAPKRHTSVQSFAGGILNKYKAGAAAHYRFGRATMSHAKPSRPNVVQQTVHVQVKAPKDHTFQSNRNKKPQPAAKRLIERIVEREKVFADRTIVLRDVTHVIRDQRTVRELAVTMPVHVRGERNAGSKQPQLSSAIHKQTRERPAISNRTLEGSVIQHKPSESSAAINRSIESTVIQNKTAGQKEISGSALQNRTLPQTAMNTVPAWKSVPQADDYIRLQAKLLPGIMLQSIRRLENHQRAVKKERLQLVSLKQTIRYSPLQLTNARRAAFGQERGETNANLMQTRQKALNRAESAKLEAERREAAANVREDNAGESYSRDAADRRASRLEHRKEGKSAVKQQEAASSAAEKTETSAVSQEILSRQTGSGNQQQERPANRFDRQPVLQAKSFSLIEQLRQRPHALVLKREPLLAARKVTEQSPQAIAAKRLIHRSPQPQRVRPAGKDNRSAMNAAPSSEGRARISGNKAGHRTGAEAPYDAEPTTFRDTVPILQAKSVSAKTKLISRRFLTEKPVMTLLRRFETRHTGRTIGNVTKPAGMNDTNKETILRLTENRANQTAASLPDTSSEPFSARNSRNAIVHRKLIGTLSTEAESLPHDARASDVAHQAASPAAEIPNSSRIAAKAPSDSIHAATTDSSKIKGKAAPAAASKNAPETASRIVPRTESIHAGKTKPATASSGGSDDAEFSTAWKGKQTAGKSSGRRAVSQLQHLTLARGRLTARPGGVLKRLPLLTPRHATRIKHQTEAASSPAASGLRPTAEGEKKPAGRLTGQEEIVRNQTPAGGRQTLSSSRTNMIHRSNPAADEQVYPNGGAGNRRSARAANEFASAIGSAKQSAHPLPGINPIAKKPTGITQAGTLGYEKHTSRTNMAKSAMAARAHSRISVTNPSPIHRNRPHATASPTHVQRNEPAAAGSQSLVQRNQPNGASSQSHVLRNRQNAAGSPSQVQRNQPIAAVGPAQTQGNPRHAPASAVPVQRKAGRAAVNAAFPRDSASASVVQVGRKPPVQRALHTLTTAAHKEQTRLQPQEAPSSGNAGLSYAIPANNRSDSPLSMNTGQHSASNPFADRGAMPALSHHRPKPPAAQEQPRQVQVEAPRELDPEKLQKMIMKLPQLHPEAIADQVYKALERKMKLEQRRRGF